MTQLLTHYAAQNSICTIYSTAHETPDAYVLRLGRCAAWVRNEVALSPNAFERPHVSSLNTGETLRDLYTQALPQCSACYSCKSGCCSTHFIVKNLTVELLRARTDRIQDSEETDLSRIQERIAHARGAGRSRVERSAACVESFVFFTKNATASRRHTERCRM